MASEMTTPDMHFWRTVSDGHNSFDVKIRCPTYDDRLHDHVSRVQHELSEISDRMSISRDRIDWQLDMVTDWREVFGEDAQPVPFSRHHLQLLIVAHPRAMLSIIDAVESLLASDLSESERGN